MVIVLESTSDGCKFWYKESPSGVLLYHRDNDMPAMIFPEGEKRWYLNNNLIREEKPLQPWQTVED